MQRAAILLIIAIGSISSVFAQMISTAEVPYMGLNGLIHTLREEAYNCSGDPAEKPWRVSEVTYDRKGNETYHAFYNADGSIGHQTSTKYNNDGISTGWSEFYGKSDFPPGGINRHADYTLSGGKVISVIVYKENSPEAKASREYDARGNMVREVSEQIGCCTTTRTYKYDLQNRLIETTNDSVGYSIERRSYDRGGNVDVETHFANSVLVGSISRVFDGKRLLKEITTWRGSGTRTTVHTYNKAGDLLLISIDDPSISSTKTFDYYPNGELRSKDQVTVAKPGGPPQDSEATPNPGRILEKYDSNGRQIERYIYDAKGALYLTQLSGYDEKGRSIHVVERSSLGPMYSRDIVYEYDSHDNRITGLCRKTTDKGEIKLLLAERKIITYFEN